MKTAMIVLILMASVLASATCLLPTGPAERNAGSELISPQSEESRVLFGRIHAKTEVTRLLLARELTLLEAAARFRRIDATMPVPGEARSRSEADGQDQCRRVINWAESKGHEAAGRERSAAVAASLEQELSDHVAAHGRVRLPEPDE
jgi:hypothetical protein